MMEHKSNVTDQIESDGRIDRANVYLEDGEAFLKVTDQRTRLEVLADYRDNYNVDVSLSGFIVTVEW